MGLKIGKGACGPGAPSYGWALVADSRPFRRFYRIPSMSFSPFGGER